MRILLVVSALILSSCASFTLQERDIYAVVAPPAVSNFKFTPLLLQAVVDRGQKMFTPCSGLSPTEQAPIRQLFNQQKLDSLLVYEAPRLTVVEDKARHLVLLSSLNDQELAEAATACERLQQYFRSLGFQIN